MDIEIVDKRVVDANLWIGTANKNLKDAKDKLEVLNNDKPFMDKRQALLDKVKVAEDKEQKAKANVWTVLYRLQTEMGFIKTIKVKRENGSKPLVSEERVPADAFLSAIEMKVGMTDAESREFCGDRWDSRVNFKMPYDEDVRVGAAGYAIWQTAKTIADREAKAHTDYIRAVKEEENSTEEKDRVQEKVFRSDKMTEAMTYQNAEREVSDAEYQVRRAKNNFDQTLETIKQEKLAEKQRKENQAHWKKREAEDPEVKAELEVERKERRAKRLLGALLSGKEKLVIETEVPTPVRI